MYIYIYIYIYIYLYIYITFSYCDTGLQSWSSYFGTLQCFTTDPSRHK